MTKRIAVFAVAFGSLVGALGGTAGADEPVGGGPHRHGHVLVLGVQYENGEPVAYRKCVDLAGGKALPLHVHHRTVHTGRAGEALRAAGHLVVPTAPLTPFADCAGLAVVFGPPSR